MSELSHIPESDYIFDKKMVCPICESKFTTKVMKSSKARKIGSDPDLRPLFNDFDSIKYGVCACPHCGYAAVHNQFDKIGGFQVKNIKKDIADVYNPTDRSQATFYTYDMAIEMHKLAYLSASSKLAKDGEKAYLCMLIAWLYRGKAQNEVSRLSNESERDIRLADCEKNEERFYRLAYDGFSKAVMNENPPIMGLNQVTLDYLLSYMAFHFGELDTAGKLIGGVLTSSSATQNIKDKAYDLKESIMAKMAESKKSAN